MEPSKQLIGLGEDRPSESVWKVKVFDFRNFSRGMEEERIGERFSEYILDSLIKLDLSAGGIANPRYSLSRSGNPEYETIIWKEYAEYAPLIAVVGHVSPIDDDRFEAGIRVATLRSTWAYYPDVVMVEEVVCSNQPAKMKEVAHMLAERIRDTIQEIMSTPL